jgi:hypothetical protein
LSGEIKCNVDILPHKHNPTIYYFCYKAVKAMSLIMQTNEIRGYSDKEDRMPGMGVDKECLNLLHCLLLAALT